jgi:hypothetical protein
MPGRGEERPEGGDDLEKQEAVFLRKSFTLRFVDGAPVVDEGGKEEEKSRSDLCSRSALLPTKVMTMLGLANCCASASHLPR